MKEVVGSGQGNAQQRIRAVSEWLSGRIIGQEALIERLLMALLCGGHLLVEGAPGLAKTRAIKELASVVAGDFHRIQFTPDLLPSDVTGTEVYRPEDGSFSFQPGPVFHNLLLADEINRAPAKVQSALLEAMAEHQVSFGRETFPLPDLFLVMATQNPIEQEGTYPLPEAQLDRFLLQIDVDYPDLETERTILLRTTGGEAQEARSAVSAEELLEVQELARLMPVGETVLAAALDLARRSRPETADDKRIADWVAWGPGPRAGQALMRCARARALLRGRLSPSVEDIIALAGPVLRHRIVLSYAARAEGIDVDHIIACLATPLG
ncbi:MAG: AAA family ATPase [Alphaproteobacteria bacterium]|nr:AAA family ATPase [Alphaproteobacteria bacterium]